MNKQQDIFWENPVLWSFVVVAYAAVIVVALVVFPFVWALNRMGLATF